MKDVPSVLLSDHASSEGCPFPIIIISELPPGVGYHYW